MTSHGYISLGPDGMRLEPAGNLLNKRVRYRYQSTCGTVVIDVGSPKVGVMWDAAPRHIMEADRELLIVVESEPVGVPEECRPVSYGALAVPERGMGK